MELQSDCAKCAGLCCAAFAFEPGPDFAHDKPAGEACRHLTSTHRCSIHAERPVHGYGGCIGYECLGAGQAATALFPAAHADEPGAVRRARFESFRILRTIHALVVALERPDMPAPLAAELRAVLMPPEGWSYSRLLDFDRSATRSRILARIAEALRQVA